MAVRNLVLSVVLFFSVNIYAQDSTQVMNWTPIINAIIQVESGGNPNARGGNSVGILQITPVCVKQCNIILKTKGSSKRYTMNDRYSIEKSKEMFILIQEYYNKRNDLERAIRLWNGGPGYTIKGTQKYLDKVMRYYKKEINKN